MGPWGGAEDDARVGRSHGEPGAALWTALVCGARPQAFHLLFDSAPADGSASGAAAAQAAAQEAAARWAAAAGVVDCELSGSGLAATLSLEHLRTDGSISWLRGALCDSSDGGGDGESGPVPGDGGRGRAKGQVLVLASLQLLQPRAASQAELLQRSLGLPARWPRLAPSGGAWLEPEGFSLPVPLDAAFVAAVQRGTPYTVNTDIVRKGLKGDAGENRSSTEVGRRSEPANT